MVRCYFFSRIDYCFSTYDVCDLLVFHGLLFKKSTQLE